MTRYHAAVEVHRVNHPRYVFHVNPVNQFRHADLAALTVTTLTSF